MKKTEEKTSPELAETKIVAGITPEKQASFDLYCIWKSLPSFFRQPPFPYRRRGEVEKERPTSSEFLSRIGIEDNLIYELSEIKTQGQFALKYNVHPDTLTDWNKRQEVKDSLAEVRNWARQLTKNMVLVLYEKALIDGDPFKIKLFLQAVEGWEEKAHLEHSYAGITEFKIVQKVVEAKKPITDGETN